MKDFINEFKQTSYYKSIFNSYEVIGIFILGSRSTGVNDLDSDYDIIVLTADGDYLDVSTYQYLKYKDRKVHWYYRPISSLFETTGHILNILCPVQLRNISSAFIIYENPKYSTILNYLYRHKCEISKIACYSMYNFKKDYVQEIINAGELLESHYCKYLYHLCLGSYYLMDETPDIPLLKALKKSKYNMLTDTYRKQAFERLQKYHDYIEKNPVDLKETNKQTYLELLELMN